MHYRKDKQNLGQDIIRPESRIIKKHRKGLCEQGQIKSNFIYIAQVIQQMHLQVLDIKMDITVVALNRVSKQNMKNLYARRI